MIFDTHSHLQFEDYENIAREIEIMSEYGVSYSTLIGSDYKSTEKALELAKKYDVFHVVAGIIHPNEAILITDMDEEISKVERQIMENREHIVGIGELGLDYFNLEKDGIEENIHMQKKAFKANIDLAKKFSLPLIVHIRDAWEDSYEMLSSSGFTGNIVIHCFTGNPEIVKRFLGIGKNIYIGFSGIVTFKNAKDIQNSVSMVPLDRILVETDAPFLTPEPFRGKKMNTSGYVKFVLDKIKELRDEAPETVEDMIFENSKRFYRV
ncbi:MAG: TatD family hydrolase [Candidatus Gracilibacteria bacterium]|nr:TatD family hydrolase [Candidatus Gracilibacteria bacterium]